VSAWYDGQEGTPARHTRQMYDKIGSPDDKHSVARKIYRNEIIKYIGKVPQVGY